jgi:hypothetical protein
MKSTLASAPNASASIASHSISEVADAPDVERSEANVVKVSEAIVGFINPFEMEQKDKLCCISSGASATSEIECDGDMLEVPSNQS